MASVSISMYKLMKLGFDQWPQILTQDDRFVGAAGLSWLREMVHSSVQSHRAGHRKDFPNHPCYPCYPSLDVILDFGDTTLHPTIENATPCSPINFCDVGSIWDMQARQTRFHALRYEFIKKLTSNIESIRDMQARQTLLAIKIHCAGGCSPRNVINTASNYALKGKFIAENKKS